MIKSSKLYPPEDDSWINEDSIRKRKLTQLYLEYIDSGKLSLRDVKKYLEKAVHTAQFIEDSYWKESCLGEIISKYLQLEDMDRAFEISEYINHKDSYKLYKITESYLSNEKFEKAIKGAEKILDKDYQLSAMLSIAKKQVGTGNKNDAKVTLQKAIKNAIGLKDKKNRSLELCEIVKIQINCDDIENVLKIVNGISGEYKSEAMYYVVEAFAKSGDFDNAKKNAEKITNKAWRTNAYHFIAQICTENGNINQAFGLISESNNGLSHEIQMENSSGKFKSEKELENETPIINNTNGTENICSITRGFEIIGSTFVYKVKILNNTPHRINDIKIQVLSYPNDCLNADTTERTVSKIEPNGGFRSLEFKFAPTHDCVQGVVNSLVTYIDSTETLQTHTVEPIVIKSVCDLLKPLEGSKYEILDIIDKLKAGAQDEVTIPDSASEMFRRFLDVLPDRNFAITDSDSKEVGGRFMGDITAAARGKYTNENIGLKITVLDNGNGVCTVHFKACGNDQSMLPTAVEEIKQILDTKALLVMNIMRTLNVIREACKVDTAHSVLLKLEELKVKVDGEVEVSTMKKLEEVMGMKLMYNSIDEQLKNHDQERICVYCDHLEGMLETGLVKK